MTGVLVDWDSLVDSDSHSQIRITIILFMIEKKEIEHIAHLARLGLSEDEKKKYPKELSSILSFVEHLQELKVSGVEVTTQAVGVKNVFRKDIAKKTSESFRKRFLKNLPEKQGGFVKVPPILK